MGVENARAVSDNGIQNLLKSDILSLEFRKEAFYEGQVVEGTIILEPKQNLVMNDILIRFKQTEYFYYVVDEKNIISEINNQVFFEKRLNAGQYLNMGSQMISLTPGSYKFPFQFTLQKNIPPSFEYPFHNRRASLRYLFSAEVLSPYVKATTEQYVLLKARPINIPSEIKHENHVKVRNVGIVSRGSSGIALFTMANNYRVNDMVPFTVDIYNEECGVQVKEVKISIKRTVTFIKNGKEYPKRVAILRKRYPCLCDKMSKNSYHYDDLQLRDNELKEAEFNKNLNPYPFIDDLNQLMPNIQTKLIRCEYSLKATSYFDLSVLGKDRPRVEMPIYVTHQLEREFQYEKDTDQYHGQGQQDAFKNYGKGFDQFANQGTYGQNNSGGSSQGNQGGFGQGNQGGFGQNNQGGFGQGNQGGFGQGNQNNQNSGNNSSKNDIGKSTKFSYEAYIAKKKMTSSTGPGNNSSSSSSNNFGSSSNNNWSSSSNQFGNYGNNNNSNPYGNNNNSNPYGNNSNSNPWGNNNTYGNNNNSNPYGNFNNNSNPYGNNNNSNPYGNFNNNSNPYGNNSNSSPYGNNNNSNPYGNSNNNSNNSYGNNNNNNPSNPFGNDNNSSPYGNNNNNSSPYGNNNNNSSPYGNNNNNSSPYGNNSNSNNYKTGSYGGGYGNGSANPFGGGSNDFPTMDNVNNQSSNSQPPNPFGDNNNSGNNNPQNPFSGGYGNSNPYSGGYPGL